MNLVARQNFGFKGGSTWNTFIGGVSGTISTPALLATKLAIDVSRISNFTIVGSDIKCKITGSYGIPIQAFYITQSTFYKDTDYLVTSIGQESFYYSNIAGFVDFINNLSVGDGAFNGTPLLTEILLKNTTSVGNSCFAESTNGTRQLKTCYIPSCTTLGTTSGDNGIFTGSCIGLKIYAHPSLATNNAGAPDGDLAYAIAQGASVRYVSNYTLPNPVTDLTNGNIYDTAIQLNFTAPTGSTNAIEYYECYANGVLKNTITASGQYITGLTPSTSYNITLIAVDIFYNKSVVSNSLSVSTNTTDYDAYNYINVSGNSAHESAIVNLFSSLKSNNLYNKIQAFYPFLGTTAAQHKWNAKNPLDTNASFRLTFSGSATFSNSGYTPNGSNGYANTYFVPSVNQNVNSNGLTLVCGTNNASASSDVVEIGGFNSATQSSVIVTKNNNSNYMKAVRMNGAAVQFLGTNESRGIFTGTKQSATVTDLFVNGVQIATGNSGGTLTSANIFIGALSLNNNPYGYSNQRIQFTAIHEGLSDTEVVTLHTIIDTFETALGRKTW